MRPYQPVGQTDWFTFPVRGNRIFTVVTQAIDETGAPTNFKALPSIGVWDAFAPSAPCPSAPLPASTATRPEKPGSASPPTATTSFASASPICAATDAPTTLTTVGFSTPTPSRPRVFPHPAVPSPFTAWVSASLTQCSSAANPRASPASRPTRSPPSLPPPRSTLPAVHPVQSTSKSTTSPASTPPPSFPPASVTTPARATRSLSSPHPRTLSPSAYPFHSPSPHSIPRSRPRRRTVLYTVTSGTATLACGLPACSVTTTGDGRASLNVTATDGKWSIITASLSNGSILQAQFAGGTPPYARRAHTATFPRCGRHFLVDRPGSRPLLWRSNRQSVRRLANLVHRNCSARQRRRAHHLQRHRHADPHRRPTH